MHMVKNRFLNMIWTIQNHILKSGKNALHNLRHDETKFERGELYAHPSDIVKEDGLKVHNEVRTTMKNHLHPIAKESTRSSKTSQ